MAPKSQTKAQSQAVDEQSNMETHIVDPPKTAAKPKKAAAKVNKSESSDSPLSPPASPPQKRNTKSVKNVKNANNTSLPTTDSEAVPTDKKLSAVPMPLVKKVKEQIGTEISFKNMSELKTILESFIQVIIDSTMRGESVTLPNYMTFKRVMRNERTHMNPKTKEKIVKPAHYVLSMYVKAQLKKGFEEIMVTNEDKEKAAAKPSKTKANAEAEGEGETQAEV